MIYKIKVKKDKTAAFHQLLQALRSMDVIDVIEVIDGDKEVFRTGDNWSGERSKEVSTEEMIKKYRDLVDLD